MLIDQIYELGAAAQDIKLKEAVLNKSDGELLINFIVRESLGAELEEKVRALCYRETGVKTAVNFKKSVLDSDVVLYLIKSHLKQKWQTVNTFLKEGDIECSISLAQITVKITLDKALKDYVENSALRAELTSVLDDNFFTPVQIIFVENLKAAFDESILEKREKLISGTLKAETESALKFIDVIGAEPYIGKEQIAGRAAAISSVKHPYEIINVAGQIKFFTRKSFIRNTKNGQTEKFYYKFNISDGTGSMAATVFETSANKAKLEKLVNDMFVFVQGPVEEYMDRLTLKPRIINLCEKIGSVSPEAAPQYKAAAAEYVKISPDAFFVSRQVTLDEAAGKAAGTAPDVSRFLLENQIVVFDTETTGLSPGDSEIIEISGVKIVNGEICETFSSLIKPEKSLITREIEQLTGINNDMVKNAPFFREVAGDFFKWTRNTVLVAYNASFDMAFIESQSKPLLYNFDNFVVDALALTRSNVKGLSNYKLVTVANALKVPLVGAHRAINDAIATAGVFLKLAHHIKA